MVTIILVSLILVTGLLGAYTMNFQKTTLILGKKLAPDNPLLPAGFQDALTPKLQTVRNVTYFMLVLVVLIYSLIYYKWYYAAGFAGLTFFVMTPILKIALPKPGSDFYEQMIKKDLLKRQAQYSEAGNIEKESAITEILGRWNELL